MVHVEVSDTVPVPKDKLFSLMSDYNNWPKLFPTSHAGVRLISKEGDAERIELEDIRYGKVIEIHKVIPPDRIEIEEFTPNWKGRFMNLFEPASDSSTRLTLKVDITGRNFIFKVIAPFSKGYIRNRVKKEIHEDLKRTARTILAQRGIQQ